MPFSLFPAHFFFSLGITSLGKDSAIITGGHELEPMGAPQEKPKKSGANVKVLRDRVELGARNGNGKTDRVPKTFHYLRKY